MTIQAIEYTEEIKDPESGSVEDALRYVVVCGQM
jgi:hypothetical protein